MIVATGKVIALILKKAPPPNNLSIHPVIYARVSFGSQDAGIAEIELEAFAGEEGFELGDGVEVTIRRHRKADGTLVPREGGAA